MCEAQFRLPWLINYKFGGQILEGVRAVVGIIAFIIILFISGYLSKRLLTSGKYNLRKSRYLESLDRLYLANDKWIEIVKSGDRIMLLGVTQGGINVLDVIKQEDLNDIQAEQGNKNFPSVLEKYIKSKIKTNNN